MVNTSRFKDKLANLHLGFGTILQRLVIKEVKLGCQVFLIYNVLLIRVSSKLALFKEWVELKMKNNFQNLTYKGTEMQINLVTPSFSSYMLQCFRFCSIYQTLTRGLIHARSGLASFVCINSYVLLTNAITTLPI